MPIFVEKRSYFVEHLRKMLVGKLYQTHRMWKLQQLPPRKLLERDHGILRWNFFKWERHVSSASFVPFYHLLFKPHHPFVSFAFVSPASLLISLFFLRLSRGGLVAPPFKKCEGGERWNNCEPIKSSGRFAQNQKRLCRDAISAGQINCCQCTAHAEQFSPAVQVLEL